MNVFIVEDQEWFLEQLKALVADVRNTQVVGYAATAQTAIAGITAANPDVVLVDLKLGEGTGFEVLRSIHTRAPHIHLLVITSFPTPGVKKACMIAGADGFFDKLLELDTPSRHTRKLFRSTQIDKTKSWSRPSQLLHRRTLTSLRLTQDSRQRLCPSPHRPPTPTGIGT